MNSYTPFLNCSNSLYIHKKSVDFQVTENDTEKEIWKTRASKAIRISKRYNGVKTPTSSVIFFLHCDIIPGKVYIGGGLIR